MCQLDSALNAERQKIQCGTTEKSMWSDIPASKMPKLMKQCTGKTYLYVCKGFAIIV